MTDWGALLAAFTAGLLGSTHCVAMCGGISSALQMAAPKHWSRITSACVYSAGRITSYVVLAGLLSWLSLTVVAVADAQWMLSILRLFGAVLLLMMAGYIGRWWFGLRWIEERGNVLFRPLQNMMKRCFPLTSGWQVFLTGALWGFLPCGLVYTGLAFSITAEQSHQAMLRMAAFGMGTLPAIMLTGMTAATLGRWLRMNAVRRVASGLLVLLAIWTAYPLIHQWSGQAATKHHHSAAHTNHRH